MGKNFKYFVTGKVQARVTFGGGGTSVYGQYGDVPLNRVWFLASVS